MEKKRWSLIFIGLCLALVFSMSPVEAQMHHCEEGNFCDRDGDGFFQNTHQRCDFCIAEDPNSIDCNDDDFDSDNDCGQPEPEPTGTILICHFKATRKHCDDGFGVNIGGGLRTIKNDAATIIRHNLHGDCGGTDGFLVEQIDGCANHCTCLPMPPLTEGTIPVP